MLYSMSNYSITNVFDYDKSTQLRTVNLHEDHWFVGKDICLTLGLKNSRASLSTLEDDERGASEIPTPSGRQTMIIINESGVYHLIFRSNKPEAKAFRKWVTGEVLPALRKHGSYTLPVEDADIPHLVNGALEKAGSNRLLAARVFKIFEYKRGSYKIKKLYELKDYIIKSCEFFNTRYPDENLHHINPRLIEIIDRNISIYEKDQNSP